MSYQVLARKWRPQNFKEMVGQEHVLRALINALDSDRLHHAYLFTGTRGVGKTTIARILAKCLNCETGVTSEPCGECNSCKEIVTGNFVDLIEVDAASRTKVEDTRELLDNVQYAPTRGRYKVYLIDEVHMLTGHSFNALLKTLEEPPPHVKFLFATTDPQKLPVTILSRCLQFNLKRMPVDMISGHLNYLLGEEKIPFDEPSLKLISRAADGSMRDALSLLDQSIAFGGNALKEDDVREMLGTISHEPLVALLKAVSAGDGASILSQVEDLAGVTPDFEAAADALISLLHQLAVQQVVPDAMQDDDSIKALANKLSKEEVQLFYQIALQGRRDLPLAPDPRSGFEMLLLRMMSFRPLKEGMQISTSTKEASPIEEKTVTSPAATGDRENTTGSTKKKTVATEKATQNTLIKPTVPSQKIIQATVAEESPPWEVLPDELNTSKAISIPKNTKPEEKVKKIHEKPIQTPVEKPKKDEEWLDVIPQLSLTGQSAELIKHSLLASKENGMISLTLEVSNQGLISDAIKAEMQTALSQYYGEPLKLSFTVAKIETKENSATMNETLSKRSEREKVEAQQQAEKNIETDPFVIELKNRFGAQVVPGSVHPK